MSKLARTAFNKKYSMPDHKVMGTVSDDIARKLTRMVTTNDQSDLVEIVNHIQSVLGTNISDISAAGTREPFTSKTQINSEYDIPTALFFLATSGTAELVVGAERVAMQTNRIYFVNERNMYHIDKQNKSNFIMMRGKFMWDPEKHGT